jgi:hypothetical protein
MRKTQLIILLLVLVLAACGQAGTGAPLPTTAPPTAGPPTTLALPTQEPTTPPEPTAPAIAPTDASLSAPTAPASGDAPSDPLVQQARRQLAQHLGVSEKTLTLHDASAQEWPNSALGCPRADEAYSEIISPGFLLNFAANGHTYAVHTDQQGARLVLCENEQPTDISSGASSDDQAAATPISSDGATSVPDQAPTLAPNAASVPIVVVARQRLAQELGIGADAISVVGVEAVEWSDSSLGCPKPDMNYLQVITPGYKIMFEAQGTRYEYHTDQRATVVRCTPA